MSALPFGRVDVRRCLSDVAFGSAFGLLAGALLFALFTLLNYESVGRNLPAARQHIAQAFASGSLGDENWRRGDTQIGQHQFNDCLILAMAVDQRPSRMQLAVTPSWPMFVPWTPACPDLRRLVSGEVPDTGINFYHRYIHGHVMLVRYLLPYLSIDRIRTLYKLAVSTLVLLGMAAGLLALALGRRPIEGMFWLILFVAFGRCFGIEAFGQSLGHAPSDMVVLLFALALAAASLVGGLRSRWVAPLAAVFGAATMIFEFLTGGIPLGLALLIGGLPFAIRDGERSASSQLLRAVSSYAAAIATCIILKILMILAVFGDDGLSGIGRQLAVRMGVGEAAGDGDQGPVRFAVQIAKGLDGLVPGMREFAAGLLLLAVLSGAWGLAALARSRDPVTRRRGWLLAGSNLVLPLWLVLFWEHSIAHAWFMDRIFVWTAASGFALFALGLLARGARRSAAEPLELPSPKADVGQARA